MLENTHTNNFSYYQRAEYLKISLDEEENKLILKTYSKDTQLSVQYKCFRTVVIAKPKSVNSNCSWLWY